MARDIRDGMRHMRRAPGFFAAAALLIALGVAATTQIFVLIDAVLLRPLPAREPQNLVQLFEQQAKRPASPFFDYGFYRRLALHSSTLYDVAGQIDTTRALEYGGRADRVHDTAVTANFFGDLGVTALLGRVLEAEDDHVAVLSYAYWWHAFGRDPKVLGRTVRLQGRELVIIGVAPEAFTGTTVDVSPDLWTPFADQRDFARTPDPKLDHYVIEIIARLRPGRSRTEAQQETVSLWNRYEQEIELASPADYQGLKRGALKVESIVRGVSPVRDQSRTALTLLLAGTCLLLLLVCANVGGLLLSGAIARERETAIRIALGASQRRIISQFLAESLLLTVVGGCAGVLIAQASMPLLMHWMPSAHGIGFDPSETRPLAIHFVFDLRVAAFSLGMFCLTAVLCGIAPAWKSSRADVNAALKRTSGDYRNLLFQAFLCGLQVALCTTLLISSGLVFRSLLNLLQTDAGFDREHVAVFSVDPHVRGYSSAKVWSLQQRLLKDVRDMPGVHGAALANRALMRGIGLGSSVVFPGQSGGIVNTSFNSVSPEYFEVMGMHFLAGRNFVHADRVEQGRVNKVVVNEAFASKFLNGRNAVGAMFADGQRFVKPEFEIIGVVNDTKYRSLREIPPPIFYSYDFGPDAYPDTFILHVRTEGDPRAIIEPVGRLLKSIDPEVPMYQAATLSQEVERSLWQERLLVAIACCFGLFSLILSGIGLYGILAQFVVRRQREIGVRMALGATAGDVIRLVARRVSVVLAAGILAGGALSSLASGWLRSVLYGVAPIDGRTDGAAAMLVVIIGMSAAVLPAVRAMRVDPSSTLRQE